MRGTVPAGATAVCRRNGTPLGSATVTPQGAATFTLTSAATAGQTYDFAWTLTGASLPVDVIVVLGPATASFTVGASPGSLITTLVGLGAGETAQSIFPNDGRVAINGSGNALVVGLTASSIGLGIYTLTTSAGRTLVIAITVVSAVQPILTKTLGAATASGVSFAQLQAGATIAVPDSAPGTYFAINASGVVSTTAAFASANLGSTTIDVAITGGGDITTLRIATVAGEVDVDTGSRLTSAITAASAGSAIGLTDTFVDGAAVTISKVFTGTITHPYKGIGPAQSIANPNVLTDTASPTMTGGLVIKARTKWAPRFNFKVTLNGPENIVFDGFAFRFVAATDSYNAKFNEVLPQNEVIWVPTLNNGAVTGVASFVQNGAGYLASPNERRVYIAHRKPTTVVTLTNTRNTPIVVTYPNHGFVAGRAVGFNTDGVLPRPLSTLQADTYYVKDVLDANRFTVSAQNGGVAITPTTDGSGTHYCGPGTGFQGYFDANADGTIDTNSPLTIVTAGSGYDSTMRFRQPRLSETTQLQTCQSNIATAESAVQLQLTTNTLSKVIIRNCSFGNPGGSVNRIPFCIDVRNAEQLYIHDCTFDNYYIGIQLYQCNDGEAARNLFLGNANDVYREYTANSPVGDQLANGPLFRVLGNIAAQPMTAVDWSNSHADFMQVGTPADVSAQHRTVLRFNRVFWPGNIRNFQTQPILNTQGPLPYYFDISDNFFISSTQNYQLGSAVDKTLCQFARNTCVRYMEEFTDINAFSPKYPSCVEPWANNKGVYSTTTSYNYGDVVKSNGVFYSSKVNANLNNPLTDTTKWAANYKYEVAIYDNIMGAIWAAIPNTTTGSTDKVLVYADPDNDTGVFSVEYYNYYALRNLYSSNNTQSGDAAYPQIFTGGATFFDTFTQPGDVVGYRGYADKIPLTSFAAARAAIDAAFSSRAGSAAQGKGYLQEGGIATYSQAPSNAYTLMDGSTPYTLMDGTTPLTLGA
ncbi:hypothetical protein [Methylorubrum suomiense]|uniref:hypothetical protein n=1 Tax=Methylorubrum suomiense TaxID=144191 RepID=UPI001EE3471D|nr:hypothetical protein [Methylorubrum suomiense]